MWRNWLEFFTLEPREELQTGLPLMRASKNKNLSISACFCVWKLRCRPGFPKQKMIGWKSICCEPILFLILSYPFRLYPRNLSSLVQSWESFMILQIILYSALQKQTKKEHTHTRKNKTKQNQSVPWGWVTSSDNVAESRYSQLSFIYLLTTRQGTSASQSGIRLECRLNFSVHRFYFFLR